MVVVMEFWTLYLQLSVLAQVIDMQFFELWLFYIPKLVIFDPSRIIFTDRLVKVRILLLIFLLIISVLRFAIFWLFYKQIEFLTFRTNVVVVQPSHLVEDFSYLLILVN